jgi:DNA-binding response OmpR family regulator
VPRRIVCIDNDPDGLEVLRLTLSSLRGVQFVSATTGRDGLALLHESRPSLLLIDLQLPDVSGATIVELCRRSTTLVRMPVVVLTADASVATRRAVEAVGVAHLAIKPFDLFELRAVVEHLLAVG